MGKLALAALAGTVVIALYATVRIWQQGAQDEQRPAGAIVVLGAAQYDGRPSAVFAARLDHAVALYLSGLAPYLVVTGGSAPGDRTTEAEVARHYALARGVPEGAILVENRGRTTLESLEGVATILGERGIRSAIFVSDRPHMLRVLRIAADRGIIAWGSPTRTSPWENDLGRRIDATFHELGALTVYFLLGAAPADELSRPEPST